MTECAVERKLNRGGIVTVLLACDPKHVRQVAINVAIRALASRRGGVR